MRCDCRGCDSPCDVESRGGCCRHSAGHLPACALLPVYRILRSEGFEGDWVQGVQLRPFHQSPHAALVGLRRAAVRHRDGAGSADDTP